MLQKLVHKSSFFKLGLRTQLGSTNRLRHCAEGTQYYTTQGFQLVGLPVPLEVTPLAFARNGSGETEGARPPAAAPATWPGCEAY